jgi:hypothetical protein
MTLLETRTMWLAAVSPAEARIKLMRGGCGLRVGERA